ncbi:hypothetical protein D3P07_14625 [Paenibacillus sp. 1011MAR3C5]|uniref:hypothetical protein n=1 Tax=Paenibacillus sp. 1011MAR3C5 TaxID=1675787 RepID=UPI000E6B76DE|nr:hypothetical protein [Paenibacillus sp. 1011MAR3C5]RJE87555.1 hypothetical protein D3P07_14625 [Paenibacillus sp. 1011MAR3C5]
MLLKKKSTLISLGLVLILAAVAYYYFTIYHSVRDISTAASYKGYPTAKALFSGADLVVIGSPIKGFEDREVLMKETSTGVIMYILTSTEIKVEKVLKGPKEDAVDLKVIEPIGQRQTIRGKERIAIEGYTAMKKGSQYLIFLGKNTFGQYGVINMQAGKFNLDGTDPADLSGENHIINKEYLQK